MQASPLPCKTSTRLAAFPALPLAVAWRRLLHSQCPALRLATIEAQDNRYRKVWELDATDRDHAEPAHNEQWQRAFQLLADPAVSLLVSQLVTAEQRKAELEQLALDIAQDCESSIRNLDDTGQTHRIADLLVSARIVPSDVSDKISNLSE